MTNKRSGRQYVGITMGTIEERWVQYVEKALGDKKLTPAGLHAAIRAEGADAFDVRELATQLNRPSRDCYFIGPTA